MLIRFIPQVLYSFFLLLLFGACNQTPSVQKITTKQARYQEFQFNNSTHIGDKKYRVYLPPSYSNSPSQKYPVLYMMDGNNLFMKSESMSGHSWNVHQVVDSLVKTNTIEEIIIVGIDHARKKRFAEYMPQKPTEAYLEQTSKLTEIALGKTVYSDGFLKFVVEEFKPHIDSTYRTKSTTEHTFVAGSSMGGLISMYAQCEYPQVFGGALCFSTHWCVSIDDTTPKAAQCIIGYFDKNIPNDKTWYFDYGTEGLDQYYEPYQRQIDAILFKNGYQEGQNWLTKKFEGKAHTESAWYQRLHIPLTFAFAKNKSTLD